MLRSNNFNCNILTKVNSTIPSYQTESKRCATERRMMRKAVVASSLKCKLTDLHKIQLQFFLLSSVISYLFPNLQIPPELVKLCLKLGENVKDQTMTPHF
uniref:Serine/threonine-protein kinase STY46-like n=1 Tax=Rhizophora mucronata TaxID=61149 RepID=A0A2P2LTA3_RHIMU